MPLSVVRYISTLLGMDDVDADAIADGQGLAYDAASGKFIPSEGGAGGFDDETVTCAYDELVYEAHIFDLSGVAANGMYVCRVDLDNPTNSTVLLPPPPEVDNVTLRIQLWYLYDGELEGPQLAWQDAGDMSYYAVVPQTNGSVYRAAPWDFGMSKELNWTSGWITLELVSVESNSDAVGDLTHEWVVNVVRGLSWAQD